MSMVPASALAEQLRRRASALADEYAELQARIRELEAEPDVLLDPPGHERLWRWFGLSRSVWLAVPRALMHAMPDDWQADMARLLDEYDAAYPNRPPLDIRVVVTDRRGKRIGLPHWIVEYRHPDLSAIARLRSADSVVSNERRSA